MMDVWKENSIERPSFSQLIPVLEQMMTEDTPFYYFEQLDGSQAFGRKYYNRALFAAKETKPSNT